MLYTPRNSKVKGVERVSHLALKEKKQRYACFVYLILYTLLHSMRRRRRMGSLLLPSGPYGSLYYYDPMMMQKKKPLQTSRNRVIDGKRVKVDSFS